MTAWQIAIETCMRQGSVALLEETRTVEQIVLPQETRTAQSLAPAIARLLGLSPHGRRGVQLVSVSVGPGSFTGIRIGVTAAKTLAYALGCRIAPCDTLAAIIEPIRHARPAGETAGGIDAAINAYRGQVFCRRENWAGEVLIESDAKDRADWLASFSGDAADPITTAGDAWAKIDSPPERARLTEAALWQPSAAVVGQLGWEMHRRGETIDPMQLRPAYLRGSAADEKRASESKLQQPAERTHR